MDITFYIIIFSAFIVTFYIWTLVSFSKDNKRNIEKYKPIVFPNINLFMRFRDSIAIFGLTFIVTTYATILSKNPVVFIPVGLLATSAMIYFTYRKMLIVYFLTDKIILWKPSLFQPIFMEINYDNIEALVFKSKDEVSGTLSENNSGPWCSINVNVENQKKSFDVDLDKYDSDKLKDFFNKLGKPIYNKIHYEKTAKRIN